jgi:hypothetical protein
MQRRTALHLALGFPLLMRESNAQSRTKVFLPFAKATLVYSAFSTALQNTRFDLEVVDDMLSAYEKAKRGEGLMVSSAFHEFPLEKIEKPLLIHGSPNTYGFILVANNKFAATVKDWNILPAGTKLGIWGVEGKTAGSPLFIRQLGLKGYSACTTVTNRAYAAHLSSVASGQLDCAWLTRAACLSAISSGRVTSIAVSNTQIDGLPTGVKTISELIPGASSYYSFNYLVGTAEYKLAAEEILLEFSNKGPAPLNRLGAELKILKGNESISAYKKLLKEYSWNYFSV